MAGSLAAASADAHAAWYNPALLSLGDHFRFGLAYSSAWPSLDASVDNYGSLGFIPAMQVQTDNGRLSASKSRLLVDRVFSRDAQPEPFNGISIGVLLPLQRMLPRFPLKVGLATSIMAPCTGACVVRVQSHTPDQAFYPVFGSRNQRLHVMAGLGIEILEDLWSVGVSASVLANMSGDVGSLTPISRFDPADPTANPPPPSKATFSQNLDTSATPLFGTLIRPLDQLSIGAWYRFAESLNLDFAVDAGVSVDMGFPFESHMPYFLDSNFFYVPAATGLALAFNPLDDLLLTAQLDWTFWSGLSEKINVSRFDVEPSAVNDDGGLDTLEQYGDFRVRSLPFPVLKARNTLSPRAGVEYTLKQFTRFRAGWARIPSALDPDQAYLNLLLDNTRHDITGGVGFSLYDPLRYIEKPVLLDVNAGVSLLEPHRNLVGLKDDAAGYHAKGVVLTKGYFFTFGIELTLEL